MATHKKTNLSRWAKNALKNINKEFPPNTTMGRHPFVVITRLLVLAKDCGIDVSKLSEEQATQFKLIPGGRHDKPQS